MRSCVIRQRFVLTVKPTISSEITTTRAAKVSSSSDKVEIVPPMGAFRNTNIGEVSITSMNILAPTYHALEKPLLEKEHFVASDRNNRYVKAISMAKQTNADILCLQEVEGGTEELNAHLTSCLAKDNISGSRPYDGCVYSPLFPNRQLDTVGLCLAWRTDRHRLVSCETFRRVMVVQLAEQSTGATIVIANLHLPAKPGAIEGRLRSTAMAVRRMQTCEAALSIRKRTALDGLTVVAGDFNSDHKSPAVKLLKMGYSLYGTIRDRNYKAKISKREAASMKHAFRFLDVYEALPGLRTDNAPYTVSLNGRGPGSMDHILFYSANGGEIQKGRTKQSTARPRVTDRRRQCRRDRGIAQSAFFANSTVMIENCAQMQVSSVLATVGKNDGERLQLIKDGLPNEQAGFYSDHIPVGCLFAPKKHALPVVEDQEHSILPSKKQDSRFSVIHQRQEAYQQSIASRRRHNKVLRCIAEWLLDHEATNMIRDVPLYKWSWLSKEKAKLTKKMRAPDICCQLFNTLVIVEVTVSRNNAEEMHKNKVAKYQDLFDALSNSEAVTKAGIKISPRTLAIVLNEDGQLCQRSVEDIKYLASLIPDLDPDQECSTLSETLKEIVTF